ncbi:PcfB family protein [Acinetobacter baumannii]|uniref:PcfB family protein n=1 Tax=Acinetobacter baumannii TaxID=470 RepID=UPI001C4900DB|nr:PcfB family protein [Acinetobacter baumannii]MBV6768884.1 PcfB family protein [Acinetobacter baumannii]
MKASTVSLEQFTELLDDSEIIMKDGSQSSTTYYLIFQGREAVLINTAFENYFITQGI